MENKSTCHMTNEMRLIAENDIYALFSENGTARLHVADIDVLPRVDAVEVVHGRWIHCQGKSNLWYCSECGEKILYNQTRRTYNIEKRPVHEVNRYCRGCGASMRDGDGNG